MTHIPCTRQDQVFILKKNLKQWFWHAAQYTRFGGKTDKWQPIAQKLQRTVSEVGRDKVDKMIFIIFPTGFNCLNCLISAVPRRKKRDLVPAFGKYGSIVFLQVQQIGNFSLRPLFKPYDIKFNSNLFSNWKVFYHFR